MVRARNHRDAPSSLAKTLSPGLAALLCCVGCGAPDPTPRRDASAVDGGAVFHRCEEGAFVDRTGSGADRAVTFGGEGGSGPFQYSPPCITIAAGQAVTFQGAFTHHPLSPGVSPSDRTAGSAGNPIPRTTSGDRLAVTFPSAGTFPYFCEMHYAAGMAGVVRVR